MNILRVKVISFIFLKGDLVACGVLSGNRNFEGRLCDCVRANYLASPPLVVAYAIAGTISIDFEKEPLGKTITQRVSSQHYRRYVCCLLFLRFLLINIFNHGRIRNCMIMEI